MDTHHSAILLHQFEKIFLAEKEWTPIILQFYYINLRRFS